LKPPRVEGFSTSMLYNGKDGGGLESYIRVHSVACIAFALGGPAHVGQRSPQSHHPRIIGGLSRSLPMPLQRRPQRQFVRKAERL
jgi:hypothetical protein